MNNETVQDALVAETLDPRSLAILIGEMLEADATRVGNNDLEVVNPEGVADYISRAFSKIEVENGTLRLEQKDGPTYLVTIAAA